jgi:hypothetical protein
LLDPRRVPQHAPGDDPLPRGLAADSLLGDRRPVEHLIEQPRGPLGLTPPDQVAAQQIAGPPVARGALRPAPQLLGGERRIRPLGRRADQQRHHRRARRRIARRRQLDVQRPQVILVEDAPLQRLVAPGRVLPATGGQIEVREPLVGPVPDPGGLRRVCQDRPQLAGRPLGLAEPIVAGGPQQQAAGVAGVEGEGGGEGPQGAREIPGAAQRGGVAAVGVDLVRTAPPEDRRPVEARSPQRQRLGRDRQGPQVLVEGRLQLPPALAREGREIRPVVPLAEHGGPAGAVDPAHEGPRHRVRPARVVPEEPQREQAPQRRQEAQIQHHPRPGLRRQLVVVRGGGDGGPLDEAGVRQQAAPEPRDVQRPRRQLPRHHVRDLVPEHRMRIAPDLEVHLAPPGLGDVGVGGAHEAALLGGVREEEGGDLRRRRHPEEARRRLDLLLAVAPQQLRVAGPQRRRVHHVAPGAVEPPPQRLGDGRRRLPVPERRPRRRHPQARPERRQRQRRRPSTKG